MFRARRHDPIITPFLINNNPNRLAQASLRSRRTIMTTTTRTDEPINLVSVNTAPERAKRLIGILIEDVKDKYNIKHAGNSDTIDGVKPLLLSIQPPPGILFCASMWTPEEQEEIQKIARDTIPGIRTAAIPTGLQVNQGPEAVVTFLKGKIDEIMA